MVRLLQDPKTRTQFRKRYRYVLVDEYQDTNGPQYEIVTAIGGKWQINHLGKQPDALKHHGFDEHCVWTGVEAGRAETEDRYWDGHIMTNGRRATASYGPDTINSFLIDFIRRKREKPFLTN